MSPAAVTEKRRFNQVAGDLHGINREPPELALYSFPLVHVDLLAKAGVSASKIRHHVRDIPAVGQAAPGECAKRDPDIAKVQSGTFEESPVQESGCNVRQDIVAAGASKHQHLGSDRRDGQATDSLFAQDRPRIIVRSWSGALRKLPFDARLHGDRQPTIHELPSRHPATVVS